MKHGESILTTTIFGELPKRKPIELPMGQGRHYRVTRKDAYDPGTPGFDKPSGRQGHYINAETPETAAQEVAIRLQRPGTYEVQCWWHPDEG